MRPPSGYVSLQHPPFFLPLELTPLSRLSPSDPPHSQLQHPRHPLILPQGCPHLPHSRKQAPLQEERSPGLPLSLPQETVLADAAQLHSEPGRTGQLEDLQGFQDTPARGSPKGIQSFQTDQSSLGKRPAERGQNINTYLSAPAESSYLDLLHEEGPGAEVIAPRCE